MTLFIYRVIQNSFYLDPGYFFCLSTVLLPVKFAYYNNLGFRLAELFLLEKVSNSLLLCFFKCYFHFQTGIFLTKLTSTNIFLSSEFINCIHPSKITESITFPGRIPRTASMMCKKNLLCAQYSYVLTLLYWVKLYLSVHYPSVSASFRPFQKSDGILIINL